MKEEQTTAFGEFHIIICGKGISEITDAEIVQPHLEKAKKTGAKIFACGFSLDKFKIDRTKIATEINIVDNGILYNFQLQNKGYSSLSL